MFPILDVADIFLMVRLGYGFGEETTKKVPPFELDMLLLRGTRYQHDFSVMSLTLIIWGR